MRERVFLVPDQLPEFSLWDVIEQLAWHLTEARVHIRYKPEPRSVIAATIALTITRCAIGSEGLYFSLFISHSLFLNKGLLNHVVALPA